MCIEMLNKKIFWMLWISSATVCFSLFNWRMTKGRLCCHQFATALCLYIIYWKVSLFFVEKIEDISLEKMFSPRGHKLTGGKEETRSLKSVPFLYFFNSDWIKTDRMMTHVAELGKARFAQKLLKFSSKMRKSGRLSSEIIQNENC